MVEKFAEAAKSSKVLPGKAAHKEVPHTACQPLIWSLLEPGTVRPCERSTLEAGGETPSSPSVPQGGTESLTLCSLQRRNICRVHLHCHIADMQGRFGMERQ